MLFEILPDPRAFAAPAADGSVQVLQFHRTIPPRVPVGHFEAGGREVVDEVVDRGDYLERVQQACAVCGAALEIRFYDHFEEEFDATVLDSLTEIRNLSIDGLPSIRHPEAVGRLPKLTSLRFGPRRIGDSKVLGALGVQRLTYFTLSGTPSPAIDLAPLAEAHSLRRLRLLGHGKNTEAVGGVTSLIELAIQPAHLDIDAFVHQFDVVPEVLDQDLDAADLVAEFSLGGQRRQNLLDATHPLIEAFEYGFHLGNQHRPEMRSFRCTSADGRS